QISVGNRIFGISLCVALFGVSTAWSVGAMGTDGDILDAGMSESREKAEKEAAAEKKSTGGVAPERKKFAGRSFFELKAEGHIFPASDIRDSEGDLEEKGSGLELNWTSIKSFNHFTQLMTSYSERSYNVDQAPPFTGSFTEVNAVRVGSTFERPFVGDWSGFVTTRLSLQSAKGTALSDGWNVPFATGVGYRIHPTLQVSAGVLGIWQAQIGTRVIPLVTLRWMPNDRFTLMTLNGARISYKLGEKKQWQVVSSILYETFVFAVTDLEGFNEDQGVVSQEYFQAQVGLLRSFGPMFEIGAYVESRFNRKFQYYKNDDKFDEFEVDSSMGFRLTGSFRF
ncbi:MAG: hypothetical protein ACQKBT_05825, partial [Puniceicoccales bacterium]